MTEETQHLCQCCTLSTEPWFWDSSIAAAHRPATALTATLSITGTALLHSDPDPDMSQTNYSVILTAIFWAPRISQD